VSYDLFFKPRVGAVDPGAFQNYFAERRNYKVDPPQAWYQNETTGVYFVFELRTKEDDDDEGGGGEVYPVSLNINYFRPSYFIHEAELEVTAFVKHFDMLVSDPQMGGMGEGEYQSDLLLRGWHQGNRFGYSAMLRDPAKRPNTTSLPSEVLLRSWQWNYGLRFLQERLGESKFVPRIMFLLVDGVPATAATWPDGIPIAVQHVDYFIVPRKDLAPRRLFKRVEDHTVVAFQDVLPLFEKHRSINAPEFVLNYDVPPKDIAKFVEALPKSERKIQGVSTDSMLDKELVEGAVGEFKR